MEPALFPLSDKGIITDPQTKLSKLFMYAFTATAQQGKGLGDVCSIQYISGLYGNRPKELLLQLENQLTTYFQRYFPDGAIVTTEELTTGDEARYTISIGVSVVHQSVTYQLHEVLALDPDMTLTRIQDAL